MRFLMSLLLLCSILLNTTVNASGRKDSHKVTRAVIYYDNDVHCHVDGYPVLAAAVNAERRQGRSAVLLVSSGDFAQGASLGAATRGGSIVDIMNAAGYDYVTLGNHEFDYGMQRLAELDSLLDAAVLDCNLYDLRDGGLRPMFRPYACVDCGKFTVAFMGISTPYSFVSSTPSFFQDDEGKFVYSLSADDIYEVVQRNIDLARSEGADYVVVLSHLGDDLAADPINSHELIAQTRGIDVVLDGHAHHLIKGETHRDVDGRKVLLTSTGSYLENIGRLLIKRRGRISARIRPVERIARKVGFDARTQAAVDAAKEAYRVRGERIVGRSEVPLPNADDAAPRIARVRESGLGDFCTDAIRIACGADVAILGGGAVRAGLPKGELSFNDIYTLFPFGNTIGKARLSGAQIADLLEYSAMALPMEFGGFMQVSGLRFTVDVHVATPVVLDINRAFAGFSGPQRRVRNIEVLAPDGSYAPIDPARTYVVAGTAYTLAEGGDGYRLLCGDDVVDTGVVDVDMLEQFISGHLGGTIPARYSSPEGRIVIL